VQLLAHFLRNSSGPPRFRILENFVRTLSGGCGGTAPTLNVGDAGKTGLLAITGTYTQLSTGAMTGLINGTTAGTGFSQLNVTGTAALAGTINFTVAAGFQGSLFAGETFTVLNASSVTGTFSNSTIAINGSFHFNVSYTATGLLMEGHYTQNPLSRGQRVIWRCYNSHPPARPRPLALGLATLVAKVGLKWARVLKAAQFASGIGCLLSVLGPIVALVLYQRATWLFAFALIGLVVLVLNHLMAKDPTPLDVADRAEQLLNGTAYGWDVDDYEHLNPREPQLRELWGRTMATGGLPEEWTRLDENKKSVRSHSLPSCPAPRHQ
jgi:hypothetical protein